MAGRDGINVDLTLKDKNFSSGLDKAKEKTSRALDKAKQATGEVLDAAKRASEEALDAAKGDKNGGRLDAEPPAKADEGAPTK